MVDGELQIFRPDNRRFLTYAELAEQAELAKQRAEEAEQQLEQERQRVERLAAHLCTLGITLTTKACNFC